MTCAFLPDSTSSNWAAQNIDFEEIQIHEAALKRQSTTTNLLPRIQDLEYRCAIGKPGHLAYGEFGVMVYFIKLIDNFDLQLKLKNLRCNERLPLYATTRVTFHFKKSGASVALIRQKLSQ